jgi:hypothetical protein
MSSIVKKINDKNNLNPKGVRKDDTTTTTKPFIPKQVGVG